MSAETSGSDIRLTPDELEALTVAIDILQERLDCSSSETASWQDAKWASDRLVGLRERIESA